MMKAGCVMAFNDHTSPQFIGEAGQLLEEKGFHGFWVPEHVLFFPEYESRYPYSADGKITGDPRSLLDPFTSLVWVAAHTKSMRLGTGICLVPQRNPVYTARMVADLDFLSGGRAELGIGIGWLREEFAALGVPWEDRAGRTADCLGLMKALWQEEVASYQGKYYSVEAACQNPKPVQKPHPPLIFGGESDAALQRVASLGDGWYGFNLTPDALEERLACLNALLEKAGRSLTDIRLYVGPAPEAQSTADIQRFAALGVQQLILPVLAAKLERLTERADRALATIHG